MYRKKEVEKIMNKMSKIITIIITALSSILILYLKNIAIFFVVIYLWVIIIREDKKHKVRKRVYNIIQKEEESIDNSKVKCENIVK